MITPTQSTVSEFSICAHQNPFECLQSDDSSEFGDDEENCPHHERYESQPIDSVFFLDHQTPEAKIRNPMPRTPKSWRTEFNLPESVAASECRIVPTNRTTEFMNSKRKRDAQDPLNDTNKRAQVDSLLSKEEENAQVLRISNEANVQVQPSLRKHEINRPRGKKARRMAKRRAKEF